MKLSINKIAIFALLLSYIWISTAMALPPVSITATKNLPSKTISNIAYTDDYTLTNNLNFPVQLTIKPGDGNTKIWASNCALLYPKQTCSLTNLFTTSNTGNASSLINVEYLGNSIPVLQNTTSLFTYNLWYALNRSALMVSTDGENWYSLIKKLNGFAVKDNVIIITENRGNNFRSEDNGVTWLPINTSAALQSINEVVASSNIFVAGGKNGLYWSTDGKSWTPATGVSNKNIEYIRYIAATNKFFAVAGTGAALYSSVDGKTWVRAAGSYWGSNFNTLCYANGVYLLGANRKISVSKDGQTWTKATISGGSVGSFTSFYYSSGKFLASTIQGYVYISKDKDAQIWRRVGFPGGSLRNQSNIMYSNGRFFAAKYPYIYTSTSGVTWSRGQRTANNIIKILFYGNSTYVAAGMNGAIYWSTDGTVWKKASNTGSSNFWKIIYFNHLFLCFAIDGGVYWSSDAKTWHLATGVSASTFPGGVVVASNKLMVLGDNNQFYFTSDGKTWRNAAVHKANSLGFTGLDFAGMAVNKAKQLMVLAMHNGDVYTSRDNQPWEHQILPLYDIKTLKYTHGVFFVGNYREIYWSIDGINWEKAVFPPGTVGYFPYFSYGVGVFVTASTRGNIYWSKDGKIWVKTSYPTISRFTSISYCHNLFLATSSKTNGFYWSLDGKTWKTVAPTARDIINAVTYNNGVFVAVGSSGAIYWSTDGKQWSKATNTGANSFYNVTHNNDIFVAVGSSGAIYWSTDGKQWSKAKKTGSSLFRYITYENGSFIVIGTHNTTIYRSSDGKVWQKSSNVDPRSDRYETSLWFGDN